MKYVIIFLTCTIFTLPALAFQHSENPGERILHKMTEHLELNEEQQTQIKQIFEDKKPEMEAIRKQMQALKQQTNTSIKAVLNNEQKAEFEAMIKKREGKHKHFSKHKP